METGVFSSENADFCKSCGTCCTTNVPIPYDDGTIVPRHPDGRCVHFVDGLCDIYEERPGLCKWFDCRNTLEWWLNATSSDQAELYEALGEELRRILGAALIRDSLT
jgi:Fe-S-cluster containining protein